VPQCRHSHINFANKGNKYNIIVTISYGFEFPFIIIFKALLPVHFMAQCVGQVMKSTISYPPYHSSHIHLHCECWPFDLRHPADTTLTTSAEHTWTHSKSKHKATVSLTYSYSTHETREFVWWLLSFTSYSSKQPLVCKQQNQWSPTSMNKLNNLSVLGHKTHEMLDKTTI